MEIEEGGVGRKWAQSTNPSPMPLPVLGELSPGSLLTTPGKDREDAATEEVDRNREILTVQQLVSLLQSQASDDVRDLKQPAASVLPI